MSDDLTRYSCQIALPGFGEAAQKLLQQAKVLVVGAGGLGCPALQYLVSAGVGTIGVADYDTISISNLHRQVLYGPADAGLKKAVVACTRLQKQNPGIKLVSLDLKITSDNVLGIINQYDIVVDGTDNFETRYLLNDTAVMLGKPLVYGAIYQYEGQVAVWNVKNLDGNYSPNYRDLYPEVDATQIPNCAEGGVIPTLAGIIGCIQANEVIKYITKSGELLSGKILVFDAQTLQSRLIKIGATTKTDIKSLVQTADVPSITAEELKSGLAENRFELIDVRTLQERDLFDIGGTHIPVEEIEENIDYFNSGNATVLYCATGKRSAEAVKVIKQKYPDANVFSLEGGLETIDTIK
ncbi:HesA/MoeB/ThiF family protein [Mucilaginibacter ginsenosidivorans]|uniref:Molybdopterin-synthase adenylyltransferase n=1 Tax=Mucilaginibacter ginsenosidivorans TaxID=398053 RepID=A0A5B8UZH5_9SPHI|nr:HesA/MoeB/ThiF family protein [Mucilaginibacter ginsenosidivorans]QEC64409.1 thiamine biosynthesis protein [Mucilaginibacter ginsenosidivorans]